MPHPEDPNWATVTTRGGTAPCVVEHIEPDLDSKLDTLRKRWADETPEEELSIVIGKELVYVGLHSEGVVLRLNDDPEQLTFLTRAMASELAKMLSQGGTA